MIYQTERDFIEKFLAILCASGKRTIPFDNDCFKNGLSMAADYFAEAPIEDGLRKQLSLLFVKQTTYGEFRRVQGIMEDMNGGIISLKNPYFVEATINMDEEYIQYLADHDSLGLELDFYAGMADAFCEGAGI